MDMEYIFRVREDDADSKEVPMNIGEAARRSGLPAKTIRYYEEIGLLEAPDRKGNGYRSYDRDDVRVLSFLCRARGLGFGMQECRELLALYRDSSRKSADVKSIAESRIEQIDRRIEELMSLRAALETLAARCHGDARPECPIIGALSDARTAEAE